MEYINYVCWLTNSNMLVHGERQLLVPAHLNFGKYVLDRLRKAKPERTCWQNCTTGEKLSYSEFTQHAVRLAAALAQRGVGRGDMVLVAGEPRVTVLPTGLAVILTGAAYTPIELECGRAVLARKLNLSRPKYVICSRLFWEAYSDILKGLDFIKTLISFEAIGDMELNVEAMVSTHVDVATFEPAAVSGACDVALVAYSSGTTGLSKGVLMTHLNCITICESQWYYDFESLDTALVRSDFCAAYNILSIYTFLCAGTNVLYTENKIDHKTLQDYQINVLRTITTVVEELLTDENKDEYDLASLKVVYSSGGPLHLRVKQEYKRRYPHVNLLNMYGATEAGFITIQELTEADTTTVGIAAPGVTIKVVDVETRAALGPHQRGEVCVRSPGVMKGYLGAIAPHMDDQGFYLTGDLGYYDDQKQFYLVDRLKDIISYRTKKVCPGEVEAVLLRHAAVRAAAVVGAPAGAAGEHATAFVVLRPGATATEAELQDHVAREVTWYMRLTGGVRFLPELPRNLTGKVLRRRLREMLEQEENV